VGAIMAVNAVGDVRDPETGRLIAGARDSADGRRLIDTGAALAAGVPPPAFRPVNTTIGVVATTVRLDKPEAARVARLAMEGYTRALSPPHLGTDGDTLFVLSVGTDDADVEHLGRTAAELVARAIVRGVRAAVATAGLPAARDLG
ncbi:MAG TPA: P1 family peptidase, partial [Methylomirabilota bacterium]|nr:P1 family peptidase [Methylomirabilota bacterium]